MKVLTFCLALLIFNATAIAQDSTAVPAGKVTVIKDPRLDILAKKEYEFNTLGTRSAKGYRLLVISSNDRDKVIAVRTKLLQMFPDQKIYMTFQAPNTKLKFGNFVEKADAEKMRDLLTSQKIVTNNVYLVQEIVEVKPDKNKPKEEE